MSDIGFGFLDDYPNLVEYIAQMLESPFLSQYLNITSWYIIANRKTASV